MSPAFCSCPKETRRQSEEEGRKEGGGENVAEEEGCRTEDAEQVPLASGAKSG